ncbi:MAG: hypothetical protein OSA97_05800 [Nevskia sp.]|nr:hypothetical protein [Nevskia sp.]
MLKPFTAEGRFESGFNAIIEGKRCALFAVRQDRGIGLGLAVADEPGYHTIPLHWCNGDDFEQMSAHADDLNRELFGLEPKAGGLIVASTMRPASGTVAPRGGPASGNTGEGQAPAWTRTVYFEANATNEYEGPIYALVEVTPEFIGTLLRLRVLCTDHGLSQARITAAPDEWGPGDIEGEMRLEAPELVVTPHLFWFTDVPKHMPFHIETASEAIDRFVEAVSGPGQPIYLGVEPEDVAE